MRNQDSIFVIISVAMTKNGRELAWKFFQQNKDELRKRYDGGHLISRLVKVCLNINFFKIYVFYNNLIFVFSM